MVSLQEHQAEFRKISKNANLLDEGVRVDYEALDNKELKENAWKVIEPYYLKRTQKLVDRFKEAQAQFLGSDDVAQISKAIIENRVDTILVQSNKKIEGRVNRITGVLEKPKENELDMDILGDLAEMILQTGGNIVMLPKERMPTDTGVAAMYRF